MRVIEVTRDDDQCANESVLFSLIEAMRCDAYEMESAMMDVSFVPAVLVRSSVILPSWVDDEIDPGWLLAHLLVLALDGWFGFR
jgi:hypothetical protein